MDEQNSAQGHNNRELEKEVQEAKKRLWENEAEILQELYDALPENLRVRQPKPKGYHKPDMDLTKGRKPRDRRKKWKQGKIKD